jgi:hypothetical protein
MVPCLVCSWDSYNRSLRDCIRLAVMGPTHFGRVAGQARMFVSRGATSA